jgi:RimJ/RimL family protein N-acetyltransferase
MIELRRTREADLDFVTGAESAPENSPFVSFQPRAEHEAYLQDPDVAHFIIMANDTGKAAGYVIVAGLQRADRVIEIRRIVVTDKGRGIGFATLEAVKALAFGEFGGNRLWLDVLDTNARARHLYAKFGFKEFGTVMEGDDRLFLMAIDA